MVNEQQLRRAIAIAEERLPEEVLHPTKAALERLDERARIEPDRTVVAMVGATGSGKSSLVNALAQADVARVAATRPTTSRAKAIVFGGGGEALLDWLEIGERVEMPGEQGLILLDLPDVDSVVTAHKAVTQRLAEAVDVLVWVLDPEKYADAVIHQEFIAPFATHGEVAVAVVNQADRLAEDDLAHVLSDVSALCASYGLPGEVLPTSARTGDGIAELRARLDGIASQRSARAARAAADVARAARALGELTEVAGNETPVDTSALVASASRAAGVDLVTRAVSGSTMRAGRAAMGWPVTRWLARFRPDPLKRLHLDRDVSPELVRTSLPAPTPIQESAVRSEAFRVVDSATSGMPQVWRSSVVTAMDTHIEETVAGLDRAIASVDVRTRKPKWWTLIGWLQWLLLAAAIVGAGWLGLIWLLDYLKMPEPDLPMAGPIPWPTALVLGGLLLGLLLGIVCMVFVRVRAKRVAKRATRKLTDSVTAAIRERFETPLNAELADWHEFRAIVG